MKKSNLRDLLERSNRKKIVEKVVDTSIVDHDSNSNVSVISSVLSNVADLPPSKRVPALR